MSQIAFGPFRLEPAVLRLLRDGTDLKLRPQAFHALKTLLRRRGEYVDYEELLREAWGGNVVSRHTVATTVAEVRKALAEYGAWLNYRPKLGYCLDVPRTDDLIRTAWHQWNRRTREGFEKALDCFQRAVLEDASDARAFEGISRSWLLLGFFGIRSPREAFEGFLEAHSHAVAFRGLTPELRCDRGAALHIFERKLGDAEAELLQAHQEDAFATVCVHLTLFYTARGNFARAAPFLEQARAADRLFATLPATETFFWLCQGKFDAAVACAKQGVELHPYQPLGRSYYAQALEYAGQTEEALRQYRLTSILSPDVVWLRALEARCLALNGRPREAEGILADLDRVRLTEYVDAYYMALLQDALGNRDAAFNELARAEEENSATLYMVEVDPKLGPLRTDPRLIDLRHRLFTG
jgi:DNA-binding winged helix-turn-helix (wHTH) protein